jgi:hypothetical protein
MTSPVVHRIRDDFLILSLGQLPPKLAATCIKFGSLGSAIRRIVTYLRKRRESRERGRRVVGCDCAADPGVLARPPLRRACPPNPSEIVLSSTIHVEHFAQAASAATSRFLDEHLDAFLELVDAALANAIPVDA